MLDTPTLRLEAIVTFFPHVHWSMGVNERRWLAALYLIGGLLGSACSSGGGDSPASSTETDTGGNGGSAGGGKGNGGDDSSSETPGNLPNLGTDPDDPSEGETPEPADCDVLALTPCVTSALDELSSCLDAGHGGTFGDDTSRCELSEADAVVTFSQAVPRWNTSFTLSFVLDVAGTTCARYTERAGAHTSVPDIELVTAEHAVTLETAADLQRTLTCDGTSVSFRQSNLSQCREPRAMPTPELADQTLDSVYQVFPMLQSNRRIFNCRFPSALP